MSEPYWTPDLDSYSECCSAISAVEIIDDMGLCSQCGEWSGYYRFDIVEMFLDYAQNAVNGKN